MRYDEDDSEIQMFSTIDEPDHRRQLRESVADFATRGATRSQIRASLARDGAFDRDRWRAMANLGWLGLQVPVDMGGIGLDVTDLSAFHQEIGRAALRDPLIEVAVQAMQALTEGTNRTLAETLLPALIEANLLCSLAWQDGATAMGARDVGPRARAEGDNWILSGQARLVPLASKVDAAVVAATTDTGVVLLWVEPLPAATDVALQADGSDLSVLAFDDLAVPRDKMIAGPGHGARILERVLDVARLATSAQLLGAMEQVFVMTTEHLKTRVQFGRPLADFQALQHRAVDLFVQIEIARSALIRAEQALEGAEPTSAAAMVSAAKSRCSDAAMRIVREAIQLHGAIGYTEEHDLSLYVTRVLTLSARLGNARAHRARWLEAHDPKEARHAP